MKGNNREILILLIVIFFPVVIFFVSKNIIQNNSNTQVYSDSHNAVYNEDNEFTMYAAIASATGSIIGGVLSNIGKNKRNV